MCGITGFWSHPLDAREAEQRLERMSALLAHRGPDGKGSWFDAALGVGLAHRRLSIVDLSAAGAQPMLSADQRWVISYNGELYNAAELRRDLAGASSVAFRGHSDTEALVEGLARWGIDDCLARCNGMFAFAAFDRGAQKLFLARDRLGIKPLYWAEMAGSLVFGSELRAVRAHPDTQSSVDPEVLAAFLRFGVVPGRRSILRGIERLRPGSYLSFDGPGAARREVVYWDARQVVERGRAAPRSRGPAAAREELGSLLRDAAQRQMLADVPVGAFLSGGIDSSTAVAMMQRACSARVRTFAVGFREPAYDELPRARSVAQALGTEHRELVLTPRRALDVIARLPEIYDEPFADSSQIPTFLVSEFARQHVKVALSGDGGDELFGGYNRYLWLPRIWRTLGGMPHWLRHRIAQLIAAIEPAVWDTGYGWLERALPASLRARIPGDKLHKLARVLEAASPEQSYLAVCSQWAEPQALVPRARRESEAWTAWELDGHSLLEGMMLHDLENYLPDDILTKVDRASMAVGLEVRVPLLDHRVVELAWSMPLEERISRGQGKAPLRAILRGALPPELLDQPKSGFGVPLGDWLRGPLRGWAEELLSEATLTQTGGLNAAPIRRQWRRHLAGHVNAEHALWPVLTYCQWARAYGATP